MLERSLVEVERLSGPGLERRASLTIYADDLPAGFSEAVGPALEAARDRLGRFAAELGLRPRVVSRARSIRALLTADVVRLEDSGAANLLGYGAVDPRVEREVEPVLRELRALLLAISRHLEGRAVARTTPPAPARGSDG